MNKKKVAALLIAGVLSIGAIGGTLAWFTSQDSVTNAFQTGEITDNDINGGVDIDENFPGDKDKDGQWDTPVLPGDTMTKEVKVESTANYNQFVRVKITKVWKNSQGNEVKYYKVNNDKTISYSFNKPDDSWKELDYEYIDLKIVNEGTEGDTWTNQNDLSAPEYGWYYYNQILSSKAETSDVLASVTLSGDMDNAYRNLKFDVIVEAQGVQATNGAAEDSKWSTEVPAASIDGYTTNINK